MRKITNIYLLIWTGLYLVWHRAELLLFLLRTTFISQAQLKTEPWSSPDDMISYPGWFSDPSSPLTLYFWNGKSLSKSSHKTERQTSKLLNHRGWMRSSVFSTFRIKWNWTKVNSLWDFMVMWYTMLPWNLPMHVLALSDSKDGADGNCTDLCPSLSSSALWVKSLRR